MYIQDRLFGDTYSEYKMIVPVSFVQRLYAYASDPSFDSHNNVWNLMVLRNRAKLDIGIMIDVVVQIVTADTEFSDR